MALEQYTIIIAIYGAFLSTALLVWKIRTDRLENTPRLKVTVNASIGVVDYGTIPKLITIDIANIGKRPVTLSSVGFDMGNATNMIIMHNNGLPRKLEEGENHLVLNELDQLKRDFKTQSPQSPMPKYAWVKDQTGKEYKSDDISKNPLVTSLLT